MLIVISLICTLFFGQSIVNIEHPFFVSVTEATYNPKEQRLEVSQKIFWDDLERAISKYHSGAIDLSTVKSVNSHEDKLIQYLKTKQRWKINSKVIDMNYQGFEIEEDVIWVYFILPSIKEIKEIDITNILLTDAFDQQKNLTNIFIGTKTLSALTSKEKPSQILKI